MKHASIFLRLLSAFFAVGIGALLSAGIFGLWTMSSISQERASKELEMQSRLTGYAIEDAVRRGARDEVQAFCQLQRSRSRFHVTLTSPEGDVIGDSHDAAENIGNQANRPEIADAIARGSGMSVRFDPTTRKDMRYHATTIGSLDEPMAVVRVGLPVSAANPLASGIGVAVIGGVALVLVLSAGASRSIARRVRNGLTTIQEHAERSLHEGRACPMSPIESDELAPLNAAVEKMTAHLWAAALDADRERHQQEAVLTSMVECVLAVDAEERLITVNKAARELFGIRYPGAQGRPVYEVLRNPDVQQLITDTLERGEMIEREFAIHGADRRIVQARGTMLQSDEREDIGVVVVLHDITRLRRLEEARREFVANVSHELRTPITSITGFVETLLDGAIEDADQAGHFLQIVTRQTDRLNAIIDDLLTLSRLEQGGLAQSGLLAPASVRTVLQNAAQVCAQEADAKSIQIRIDCEDAVAALIHEELIAQAVANLVQNAIKYSESGSSVTLRGFHEDGFVVLAVEDQGVGIEPGHLPRLFERFYRVDRARSREMGGTGLGLAIVKHIAQAHGGSVEVKSVPGAGSTFCLRIPAHSQFIA